MPSDVLPLFWICHIKGTFFQLLCQEMIKNGVVFFVVFFDLCEKTVVDPYLHLAVQRDDN